MDPIVPITVSYALAALWLTAAIHKVLSFGAFLQTLRAYRIVPQAFALPSALIIVASEAGLAAALLTPIERALPLSAAAGLLALYAAAIGVNLARGRRHIDCGCMGPGSRQPLGAWIVWRNLGLAAGALAAGWLPADQRALHWLDAVSICAAVAVLAVLYATLNRLIAGAAELAGTNPAEVASANAAKIASGDTARLASLE